MLGAGVSGALQILGRISVVPGGQDWPALIRVSRSGWLPGGCAPAL